MASIEEKLQELEGRIAVLEQEKTSLLERLLILEAREAGADSRSRETAIVETAPGQSEEKPFTDTCLWEMEAPEMPEIPVAKEPKRETAERTDKTRSRRPAAEMMEAKIGGTWLNRIGIVAFVFGLGFFLKYSFDNNWIGPTGRVVIGILAGMCLLAVGEIGQRKGYRMFAQGLTGGGIAALYFAIFAAFSFYHLIGQLTAFGIMILVTLTAVLLSVRYDAYAIAVLGIIGGFLTPFFLSTGKPNEVGLFSYIALLDCGILALAYFKKWRSINVISFVLTLIILGLWIAASYSAEAVWTNQVFYIVFFAIFACLAVFYNMVHREPTKPVDLILITANAAVFFCLSYINLEPHYGRYIGFLALVMAVVYFILGYLAWIRHKEDRFLVLSLWGISVVFLTITMPLQLHGKWITVAWAVESVVLLWVGVYSKSYATRMAALGVMAIAMARLLSDSAVYRYLTPQHFLPVANIYAIPFAACIAGVFVTAYLYRRNVGEVRETEKTLWLWFTVLGTGLAALYFSLETFQFCWQWGQELFGWHYSAEQWQALGIAVIWFTESMILVWFGVKNRFAGSRLLGVLSFLASAALLFGPGSEAYLYTGVRHWPLVSWRSVPFLYGIVSALWVARKYAAMDGLKDLEPYVAVSASVAANLMALGYLSLEVISFYHSWEGRLGLGTDVENAVQMTLSVVWTIYAIGLVAAGFIWKNRALRLMSIVIFAVTILKVFLFDLSNLDTIYRIVSFIVLGGLLVIVSFLYQRYKDRIFGEMPGKEHKEA